MNPKILEKEIQAWLFETNLDRATKELPTPLLQLFTIVYYTASETYLVGGCVRDMILGRTPKDYDIVTSASITELQPKLIENGWEVKGVGDNFLVYVVSKTIGETHWQFEIANFRKESKTSDGRRPDSVSIGTIEDDAARRDFTINSIYYNPLLLGPNGSKLTDYNGGIKDLAACKLKFIGKPKDRIKEDYLRVFRCFRFASTLNFNIDTKSLKACREMWNEAYTNTTPERARMEIERML